MDYQVLFGLATNIILLPVLSLSLLIAYLNKREFLEKSGFDKPVIGMIIIGSFFGVFVDIPLIIFEDSLLNINLGGALIPVIVCGVLIYNKMREKSDIFLLIFGIGIISLISYRVSYIAPGRGIIAEFPWYLAPAFGALLLALILGLIKKNILNGLWIGIGTVIGSLIAFLITLIGLEVAILSEFAWYIFPPLGALLITLVLTSMTEDIEFFSIPYAYTVAVLGTLIGADFIRIPELIDMGVLGSFGGAGAMDLVYLSGLIAAVPLIFIYYFRHDYSIPTDPLSRAKKHINIGDYRGSKQQIINGLKKEIDKAHKLLSRNTNPMFLKPSKNPIDVLRCLGFNQTVVDDYITLNNSETKNDLIEAKKDLLTGKLLRMSIKKKLSEVYTSFLRRFLAYLLDLILLSIPFVLFFFLIFYDVLPAHSQFLITEPIVIAVISLAISIQFIYFTLTEWYFGKSLGKALAGLKVLDDDLENITFTQSAARNSGRYADIVLGFYMLSFVLILRDPEKKRIGDYIAGTRVVKTK